MRQTTDTHLATLRIFVKNGNVSLDNSERGKKSERKRII